MSVDLGAVFVDLGTSLVDLDTSLVDPDDGFVDLSASLVDVGTGFVDLDTVFVDLAVAPSSTYARCLNQPTARGFHDVDASFVDLDVVVVDLGAVVVVEPLAGVDNLLSVFTLAVPQKRNKSNPLTHPLYVFVSGLDRRWWI